MDYEKFGIVGIIAIIIIAFAWWWVLFVAVGICLDWVNFQHEGRLFVQVVIWAIVNGIVLMIGRIGQK